ncbi:hypothetical protein HY524_01910 [Candidatus Berkelbacteria bacterium]|nr:hypothetical protein [Candidatus Berkelbacteria bacterium]
MTVLAAGGDRDQFSVWIIRNQTIQRWTCRQATKERNDLAFLHQALEDSALSLATIDILCLVMPEQSRTTVRVVATLLATLAWYVDRPLRIFSVSTINDLEVQQLTSLHSMGHFDATVLDSVV